MLKFEFQTGGDDSADDITDDDIDTTRNNNSNKNTSDGMSIIIFVCGVFECTVFHLCFLQQTSEAERSLLVCFVL